MKKKLVHLVYSMGCGGLEKVIVNLINGTHEKVEHVIITLTPEFEMIDVIVPVIDVFCLEKRPGKDLGCHLRLYKLLKQISPDVINTYNFGTIEYHVTAFLAGVKLRVHSDHGHGGDAQDGLNKKNNLIRRVSSFFIHDYVVVSQDLMDWVTKIVKVKPHRLHLIQNGVEVQPSYTALEKAPAQEKVVCTVGRLDPVKNQSLLIRAFKELVDKCPVPVKLKIIGDGSERSKLESLTNELNLQKHVEFLGYREDIRHQLEQCDVFVLSSHYEAMPMTILETMAVGRPVVTTDVGGIRHFIDDSVVSFVEPDNKEMLACEILSCVTTFPADKVEKAHKLVFDKYSISAMAERYLSVYSTTTQST